jgi:Tfp pilus assembly protein PilO
VAPLEERLGRSEAEWAAARGSLAQRQEAHKARKDLARVLTLLPVQREFARLPLAISDMAHRDRVALPSLSYALEKTGEGLPIRAVLQGTVTGQYEDLRRFIHHVEASDRLLLFVEDLSVGRSSALQGEQRGKGVTITLRLATYIREETPRSHALRASVE